MVQAFNCISNGLIGVCVWGCVFFFFFLVGFNDIKLSNVEVMQSISDGERFERSHMGIGFDMFL